MVVCCVWVFRGWMVWNECVCVCGELLEGSILCLLIVVEECWMDVFVFLSMLSRGVEGVERVV